MGSIDIRSLSKKFGEHDEVIADFSLHIEDREFISLLGPSGCGKSTILRMVAGLEDPSSGEIIIGDKNVTALEPRDRDIAMVFQNYALYPHKTVYENLAYGLKIRKTAPDIIRKRVDEVKPVAKATRVDSCKQLRQQPPVLLTPPSNVNSLTSQSDSHNFRFLILVRSLSENTTVIYRSSYQSCVLNVKAVCKKTRFL